MTLSRRAKFQGFKLQLQKSQHISSHLDPNSLIIAGRAAVAIAIRGLAAGARSSVRETEESIVKVVLESVCVCTKCLESHWVLTAATQRSGSGAESILPRRSMGLNSLNQLVILFGCWSMSWEANALLCYVCVWLANCTDTRKNTRLQASCRVSQRT
jgi:hypothetical protein